MIQISLLAPESKVSSSFTVPVLPLRISSKHCVDISFSKKKGSLLLNFGSSPGARTKKYKLRKLKFKIVREDTSIFKSKIQK